MCETTYTAEQVAQIRQDTAKAVQVKTLNMIAQYTDQFREPAKQMAMAFVQSNNHCYKHEAVRLTNKINSLTALKNHLKKDFRKFVYF